MRKRTLEPEIMDDPTLDWQRHLQALRGLERINRVSGSARILWKPIQSLAGPMRQVSLRVLDVATGAGDIPIHLWLQSRRAALSLEIDGCDRSPAALGYARQRAHRYGAGLRFFELDALREEIPRGYDIILCSLFLHHLDDQQAVRFLRGIAQAAKRLVLVNDLIRNRAGLALATVGTRLLSASSVVRADGPRSVRAAFTIQEVCAMAENAGMGSAAVVHRWPCRFLLSWRRT